MGHKFGWSMHLEYGCLLCWELCDFSVSFPIWFPTWSVYPNVWFRAVEHLFFLLEGLWFRYIIGINARWSWILILIIVIIASEMPNMGLSGTLSPSIGNLSHLRTMWAVSFPFPSFSRNHLLHVYNYCFLRWKFSGYPYSSFLVPLLR